MSRILQAIVYAGVFFLSLSAAWGQGVFDDLRRIMDRQQQARERVLSLAATGKYDEAIRAHSVALGLGNDVIKTLGPLADDPMIGRMVRQFRVHRLRDLHTLSLLEKARGGTKASIEAANDCTSSARAIGDEMFEMMEVCQLTTADGHLELGNFPAFAAAHTERVSWFVRKFGESSVETQKAKNGLALAQMFNGDFGSANALLQRSMEVIEGHSTTKPVDVRNVLLNLSDLNRHLGRPDVAISFVKRALAVCEQRGCGELGDLGSRMDTVRRRQIEKEAVTLLRARLGNLLVEVDRAREAIPLLVDAAENREALWGASSLLTARAKVDLGLAQLAAGEGIGARQTLEDAAKIVAASGEGQNDLLAEASHALGIAYLRENRAQDAVGRFRLAAGIYSNTRGVGHPATIRSKNDLANALFEVSDWSGVITVWRSLDGDVERRRALGLRMGGRGSPEATRSDATLSRLTRDTVVKALFKLGTTPDNVAMSFVQAQQDRVVEAAEALRTMASRSAAPNAEIGRQLRRREELTATWRFLDNKITAAHSQASSTGQQIAALRRQLGETEATLERIDQAVLRAFPVHSNLYRSTSSNLEDVKAALRADEALVFILDTSARGSIAEETFVWVITKEATRWVRSDWGTKRLTDEVHALRCGLDLNAWRPGGEMNCAASLGVGSASPPPPGAPLPFNVQRAHALYGQLFGGVEDIIRNKHIYVVPSGTLSSIPFNVLVTEPQREAIPISSSARSDKFGYAHVPWLGMRQPLTVLPAVSSLSALRKVARPSRAGDLYSGWGAPALDGNASCVKPDLPGSCPSVRSLSDGTSRGASFLSRVVGSRSVSRSNGPMFRNGRGDPAEVRKLCPLPDTAHELKCVAESLGALSSALRLGDDMNKRAFKQAKLDNYRIIHLATHGLMSGEVRALVAQGGEPALVFSPKQTGNVEDDGLLTASEIGGLKLDAEWVILSACNTAAGGQDGNEALSGLAKAFFYAGARALLVSHWEVNSEAAVVLVTEAMAELSRDGGVGRSEAMRRAMGRLIATPDGLAAHPMMWAPFVVVGEGSVVR